MSAERLASAGLAEDVNRREKLSEELIDEPVKVRLDVGVDVLARLLDDAIAQPPESCELQEMVRHRLPPLLRIFTPLRPDLILDDDR